MGEPGVVVHRLFFARRSGWLTMPRGDVRLRAANGDLNQVAARVKERRRVLGVTQEELCARIAYVTEGRWNADRQEIVRIESGGRIVSDVELIALAGALSCRPCWLLMDEGEVS